VAATLVGTPFAKPLGLVRPHRGVYCPFARDPESGRQGVQLEIDRNRITPDIDKAKQKISGAGGQAEDKPQGQKP
jgi:hypothetical protein